MRTLRTMLKSWWLGRSARKRSGDRNQLWAESLEQRRVFAGGQLTAAEVTALLDRA